MSAEQYTIVSSYPGEEHKGEPCSARGEGLGDDTILTLLCAAGRGAKFAPGQLQIHQQDGEDGRLEPLGGAAAWLEGWIERQIIGERRIVEIELADGQRFRAPINSNSPSAPWRVTVKQPGKDGWKTAANCISMSDAAATLARVCHGPLAEVSA